MNRAIFLVDGFNLYHSLVRAQDDNGGQCVKWLDLSRLCRSFLPQIRRQVKDQVELEGIHYFSAPPTHCSTGTQKRHHLYMTCLRLSGVQVHLGRFKRKIVKCSLCHASDVRHEEKETDVAIAATLFELCHLGTCDSIVLMTGDTDLAPAVRTCRALFPRLFVCFAFPYARVNEELRRLAPGSFKMSRSSYLVNQYPNPLVFADGTTLIKPAEWA